MTDLRWSTNTDWTNAQSTTNIDINSGTFELADAIPDSVLIQYLMDEGSGTSLADNSGNGNIGNLFGAGWQSDANAVGGFQTTYDGGDDYGEVNNSNSIVHDEFTVILTMELHSVSGLQSLFTNGLTFANPGTPGSSRFGWYVALNDDTIRAQVVSSGSGDIVSSTSTLSTSTKTEIAFRLSSSELSLHINGSNDNTTSRTVGTPNDTQYSLTWARDPDRNDFHLNADLGTIEYYPEAISDSDISSRHDSRPWS